MQVWVGPEALKGYDAVDVLVSRDVRFWLAVSQKRNGRGLQTNQGTGSLIQSRLPNTVAISFINKNNCIRKMRNPVVCIQSRMRVLMV